MALASPHPSFNRSTLVRCLSGLEVGDAGESKQSFAARLGTWFDLSDAISLSAALRPAAGAGSPAAAVSPGRSSVGEEFARVRAALIESIGPDDVLMAGNARIKFPLPATGTAIDGAADFSPYHRYYLAHQREMEAGIGPLRARVRAALSGFSPALRQLAALDAVLEEAFWARERSLLGAVPLLLEKRFEHWRGTHLAFLAETQATDAPERWIQPGGWLAGFCGDMQRVLRAELDLRLQPVAGLVEALGNEEKRHP
ncbi:MAG: hypothetical protein H6R10_3358 [Rhodocyclaceae bacterium]|nr:hypothetical protein [Rhodocyclaceae bacterium]